MQLWCKSAQGTMPAALHCCCAAAWPACLPLPVLNVLLNMLVLHHFLLEVFLEVLLQAAAKCLDSSLTRSSL
jgi:hypothetical protein